jgi:hypothetical protein
MTVDRPRVVRLRKTTGCNIEITYDGDDDGQPVPPDRVYLYPEPITIIVASEDLRRVVRETALVRDPRPQPSRQRKRPKLKSMGKKTKKPATTTWSPTGLGREARPSDADLHGCVIHPPPVLDEPADCHLVFRYIGGGDLRVYGLRRTAFFETELGRVVEVRLPAAVTRARDEPHMFGVARSRLAGVVDAHRRRRLEITECGGQVTVKTGEGLSAWQGCRRNNRTSGSAQSRGS